MSKISMKADIAVIGSGASGLAAALEAARSGARVIVFEKQPSLGGTSNFFEGMFAAGSAMQKEKYISYSSDQAFKNFMEYNHWRSDARLVRSLIDRSAETIDWLKALGVEFLEVTINMPDAPRTYHVVKGKGKAVVKALALKAKEKGVVIRTASPVKQLLKGNNRLSGIVAELDGKDAEVSCKAVVIASGGYANNPEWIKKHTGFECR
jgi:fumarate reductase flavoprotein subunit